MAGEFESGGESGGGRAGEGAAGEARRNTRGGRLAILRDGSCVPLKPSFIREHRPSQRTLTMTEREDNVYRAKLAEQAERYDGKGAIILIFPLQSARPSAAPL